MSIFHVHFNIISCEKNGKNKAVYMGIKSKNKEKKITPCRIYTCLLKQEHSYLKLSGLDPLKPGVPVSS